MTITISILNFIKRFPFLDLSIIIPCLNEYSNLKQLLPFLLRHSDGQTEIIVVDASRSEDNTNKLCEQLEVRYIKSSNSQRAGQMNHGARQAKGGVLFFLHADVLPPSNFCAIIKDRLSNLPGFGLFPYQFKSQDFLLKINAYFTKYQGFFSGGGDQCHFISKSVFNELGGYNASYDIMEDFEFFDRVRKNDIDVALCSAQATVSARKYDTNSYLRVNLTNLTALVLYKLNVPPARIKSLCAKWIKHEN